MCWRHVYQEFSVPIFADEHWSVWWGDRLFTTQAPRLLRQLGWLPWRKRDCTSGPPPHNSGEYIGAGEIAPQGQPQASSHNVEDLVADACRFERLRQRSTLTLLSVSKVANELVKGFPENIGGSAQPDCSSGIDPGSGLGGH